MSNHTIGLRDVESPSRARAGANRANPAPLGVPPRQAWGMLGISNSTGYELLGAGELDSYTVGRARRITVESIHRYIARRLKQHGSSQRRRGRPAKHASTEART